MTTRRFAIGLVVVLAALGCSNVHGFFHAWVFTEFFSNADGSIQFIEMHTTLSTESQASGGQIRTTSGKTFSFPGNLSGNTTNRRVLIATPGFSTLSGGVPPDFTLPSTSFFNPAGDTIRLFHPSLGEFHSRTFPSVPTNGVNSLNFPPTAGSSMVNSPTNFAGTSGSVNLSPPAGPTGDYNGNGAVDAADYVVWRNTLNQTVSAGTGADGSGNAMVDAADYNFWRARFGTAPGSGSVSGVPEPTTAALTSVTVGLLGFRPTKRRFD